MTLGFAPWAAASGEEALARAERSRNDIELAAGRVRATALSIRAHRPEQLLLRGELHLRTAHFEEAIREFSKVIELALEGAASADAEADAHLLIADAYFQTNQLHSARRHYELILERSSDQAYDRAAPVAAVRLVDAALGLDRRDLLPNVLERIESLQKTSSSAAGLRYARAKALLALDRYDEALLVSTSLDGEGVEAQRVAYLRGVAQMKKALGLRGELEAGKAAAEVDYGPAIAEFEAATRATNSGTAASASLEIADLARLAIARLCYDQGQLTRAAAAYQKVPRTSKYFATALFELAWTFVRTEEYERAQRSLEVLKVLDPGLVNGADAALLRADLLLRAGRYREAEEAYDEARVKYEPIHRRVDEYVRMHDDPAVYYDQLTASELEINALLPPVAFEWAREEAKEERIFAILDDVARSRKLIRESKETASVLRAALGSSARAKVFPAVKNELELVVGLRNQIAVARLTLARGMDEEAGQGTSSVKAVRNERRKLMTRLGQVPTRPGDFTVREAESEKSWNTVGQRLQRLELEANHLGALVNGLKRVLAEAERHGVSASPEALASYRAEVESSELELAKYHEQLSELREQVTFGKAQSGFGDERFTEDTAVRDKFRLLFDEELKLVASGGDPSAKGYAQKAQAMLVRFGALDKKLEAAEQSLDRQLLEGARALEKKVTVELDAITLYSGELEALDGAGRLLVGEVARDNFRKVRDRLANVVMRADVGLIQKSWEVREEQMRRVRVLLRERALEERFINDELREVLDDAGELQ